MARRDPSPNGEVAPRGPSDRPENRGRSGVAATRQSAHDGAGSSILTEPPTGTPKYVAMTFVSSSVSFGVVDAAGRLVEDVSLAVGLAAAVVVIDRQGTTLHEDVRLARMRMPPRKAVLHELDA
jgi:hypothetical protein